MDRLASCYFCGVAVEAPLEEYPVVPRDLRPDVDEQSTVVLCPSCRRKLSTVIERVVSATADDAQTDLTTATAEVNRDDRGPTVDAVSDVDVDRPDLLDFDGDDDIEIGGEDTDPDAREADSDRNRADENPRGDSGNRHGADRDPDDADDSDASSAVSGGEANAEDSARSRQNAGRSDAHNDPDTSSDRSQPGKAGSVAGQPARNREAGAERGATDREFSTSSYNRVVRLLQNREFPVPAEEIQTVAANAYGIGRRETAAILGALVDRGVLERDGSQLRKPEE